MTIDWVLGAVSRGSVFTPPPIDGALRAQPQESLFPDFIRETLKNRMRCASTGHQPPSPNKALLISTPTVHAKAQPDFVGVLRVEGG